MFRGGGGGRDFFFSAISAPRPFSGPLVATAGSGSKNQCGGTPGGPKRRPERPSQEENVKKINSFGPSSRLGQMAFKRKGFEHR